MTKLFTLSPIFKPKKVRYRIQFHFNPLFDFGFKTSMNYIYCGDTNWELVTSFIVRGALSEHKGTYIKPPKQLYQKGLFLLWSWMMLVLISAYKGNLLAIITKPSMKMPFMNVEDMVEQTQMKWGFNSGVLFRRYAMSKPPGTTLLQLI